MAIVDADAPPTDEQVQFAQRSAELMQATVFAALLQEFAETTAAMSRKASILSLIFDDRNESGRIVDLCRSATSITRAACATRTSGQSTASISSAR